MMNKEPQNLDFCDNLSLWWFFHSNPSLNITYGDDPNNVYCSCFSCCCPGCLELECNSNCFCRKGRICLFICCTFMFT